MTEPRRPKLQFQIRRTGPVPIPPGQLCSDAELLHDRLAASYKIVADLEFTRLLHRIKGNPAYRQPQRSSFGNMLQTAIYIEGLPKE